MEPRLTITLFTRSPCLYSGTPPYDHPVQTTSLLRPYSFKPKVKDIDSFYYFEDPVNATTSLLRPGFYGPTVVVLTGFHCTNIFYDPNVKITEFTLHNRFYFILFYFFALFTYSLHWNFTLFKYLTEQCQK